MALIEWNDELSIGIAEIDKQHQQLACYINELNDAMSSGQGQERLNGILGKLASYTVSHFKTEEDYFAKYDYPQAAAHIKTHKKFVEQVSSYQTDLTAGKIMLSISVMDFLKDWLVSHIQGEDRKYVSYFKADAA